MKTVEHFSPQHKIVEFFAGGRIVLRVDPVFELRRYRFMVRVLLKHGKEFLKQDFPTDRFPILEDEYRKRCYDGAMELAQRFPNDLTYCEGVIIFSGGLIDPFPLPHGWTCTADGRVVDPTMAKNQNDENVFYAGVPIKLEYAMRWHRKYGFHGILDGHPEKHDKVGVYVDSPARWMQDIAGLKSISKEPKGG